MKEITHCPICQSTQLQPITHTTDHTVSGEQFKIIECSTCTLRITSPRPDDLQLGKYYQSTEYISHTNKATGIINSLYLIARKFTLSWKLSLLRKYATGIKLLDYGCGTGEFLHYAKNHKYNIQGVEPATQARKKAIELNGENPIFESIEEIAQKTDIITLWHVLEHVPDPNIVLEQLKQILEQNGTLFIAVPNPSSWDSSKYAENWAAYDTPRHLWHFTQKSMRLLLKKHQLQLIDTLPMKLDSFYISLMSEKNIHGKLRISGMINAFSNGLKSNLRASKTGEYSSLIYIIKHEL